MQATVGVAAVGVAERDLDALYREHAPAALRLAILLTGDRSLAEDVVQDAFVRVAMRKARLRELDAFGSYLNRAVANQVKDHFRHQQVVKKHAPVTHQRDRVSDPELETRDALWQALQQLPARQRAALVLRFYEDMTEADIADALGCRLGTAKSLVSRGLAQLRKEIDNV